MGESQTLGALVFGMFLASSLVCAAKLYQSLSRDASRIAVRLSYRQAFHSLLLLANASRALAIGVEVMALDANDESTLLLSLVLRFVPRLLFFSTFTTLIVFLAQLRALVVALPNRPLLRFCVLALNLTLVVGVGLALVVSLSAATPHTAFGTSALVVLAVHNAIGCALAVTCGGFVWWEVAAHSGSLHQLTCRVGLMATVASVSLLLAAVWSLASLASSTATTNDFNRQAIAWVVVEWLPSGLLLVLTGRARGVSKAPLITPRTALRIADRVKQGWPLPLRGHKHSQSTTGSGVSAPVSDLASAHPLHVQEGSGVVAEDAEQGSDGRWADGGEIAAGSAYGAACVSSVPSPHASHPSTSPRPAHGGGGGGGGGGEASRRDEGEDQQLL